MNINDWTIELARARRCKRWSVYPDDVLDLTVAEMDFPTAEPVLDAIRDAVERQSFGYPIPDAHSDLPRIGADWLRGEGLVVEPAQVRVISDIIKGLVNSIKYFTRPRSAVAVITPTYSRFLDAVEVAERTCLQVPMINTDDGYRLDYEALELALQQGAGSILLCNPSNPTGRLFTRSELGVLSDLAAKYGVRVLSDEVHAPIRYQDTYTPFASISAVAAEQSITFTSASKAWNIPGLRCALVVFTNPTDNDHWDRIPRASKGGISPLGMAATAAAFTHGQPWLSDVLKVLRTNKMIIESRLAEADLGHLLHSPEASYLAWLDLRVLDSGSPQRLLLDRVGVATTDGAEHGAAGHGFVRLNFASPSVVVEEAMDRLLKFLPNPAVA